MYHFVCNSATIAYFLPNCNNNLIMLLLICEDNEQHFVIIHKTIWLSMMMLIYIAEFNELDNEGTD